MDIEIKRVIITTDPGFDDYWAILMFLFMQRLGLVKIEAIACTAGNTDLENACKNTVRLLELTGSTDIPVYKGTPPKRNDSEVGFYLVDGFGDIEDLYQPQELSAVIRNKSAEQAISDIVEANPNNISLICLGPLTYLAAIIKSSNSEFTKHVKDVWIMGGNDPDNTKYTPAPEFNFQADPVAADVVLKSMTCPVFLLPFETFLDVNLTLTWRRAVLNFTSPTIETTSRVERKVSDLHQITVFSIPDAELAFAYFDPLNNIESMETVHVDVELTDPNKLGQLTFSQVGQPKINVIKKINTEILKRFLVKVARSF